MSSLSDLEIRVAALEADRADYRAVLTAVGVLRTDVDGVTTRVDHLTTKVDGLSTQVDHLTTKVDGLSTRMDGVENRLDGVEHRLDGVEHRLDGVDNRLENVEIKTDANRESINALGEKLAGFQIEVRDKFASLEKRMDARFRSVDEQFAELKELILDRLPAKE